MALLSPPTIGPGPLSPRDAAELSRALKDMYRLMGNLSVSPPLQLSMGSAGSVLSLNGDGFMSSSEALEVKTTNPGTGDSDVDVLNVTVIQIDQASGLQEVDNGSGNVTLQAQDASATHSGVVNLSAQTLGVGPKVFVVDSSATFGSTTIGIASTTGAAVILLGIGGIGVAKSQGTMRVESPDAANFSIF